jgi:hypothetical protein
MPFVFITGGAVADMKKADLTSQVNGSRTVFTVPSSYQANSLRVYYNGVRQESGNGYSETSSTTFTLAFTPENGETISIDYLEQ